MSEHGRSKVVVLIIASILIVIGIGVATGLYKRLSKSGSESIENPGYNIPVTCTSDEGTNWAPARNYQSEERQRLNMWVENAWLTPEHTSLDVAVKVWEGWTSASLRDASGAYFVDDAGKKYELLEDHGEYVNEGSTHLCRQDEICRFTLIFPRLTHKTQSVYFHHPQFERLRIILDWKKSGDVPM